MADAIKPMPKPSIWVIVPPPIWALLFLLAGWGVGAALRLPAVVNADTVATVIAAAGFIVALWGRLTFASVGAEIRPASPKNSTLVIKGPFRFTRNPMYLGILVFMTGLALLIGTITALAAVLIYFLWVHFISIPYEEEKMESQFGEEYRAYKRRVRRWL